MSDTQEENAEPAFITLQDSKTNIEHIADEFIPNATTSFHQSNLQEISVDSEVQETIPNTNEKSSETSEKQDDLPNPVEEDNVQSPTGENFIFKCIFCDKVLTANDDPKLLECLHNSCGNCINNKVYEQNISNPNIRTLIECTACGMICDPTNFIDNHFLLELNNSDENPAIKTADIKCSSCSDDAIAVSYCVECSEYICNSCVEAHQRLKITKDHTIKTKEEGYLENLGGSSGSDTLHCTVHPHEKLSLFCETCDKLTCRDCQLLEHRDHKYKFTHEIASDTRKFISTMLKDVCYKRVLLNSAMKVIDDRQTLISDKKLALVKEITQLVVKLTNTINVRGKQLISRLSEVCDQKQKTLQEKKVVLDQISKMTDHCIDFTQHAVDNGSDMALLYSKKQVTAHLLRIKCKRADIPNPEIPVRIHLALDKVPDLIKGLSSVISTIGQIVVDGRVYPPAPVSPAGSLPPHGSPSPNNTIPPQQPSPLNQQLQQQPLIQQPQPHQHQQMPLQSLHQQPPTAFQQPRMPPPYSQYQQQNIAPNLGQQKSGVGMNPNIPQMMPSLAQHLQQNLKVPIPRPQMGRQMIPMVRMSMMGHQQQQQVSSSTHPQGLMQERSNVKNLLPSNNSTVYVQTGPNQYQAVQTQYAQQYQNRYSTPPGPMQQFRQQPPRNMHSMNQPYRMHSLRVPAPSQHMPTQVQAAKWHIPQQNNDTQLGSHLSNVTLNRAQVYPAINDNFKITLKSQTQIDTKPATVSSTIPKTPSPNHIQGKSDTESNLDKYCQDSVNDLMATIAKLDSNGVQVLAEGRSKTGGSPHVDSSTDDLSGLSRIIKTDTNDIGKDDPNEDWCAVCMDGGELVCCDKCPKVFHQLCHIPNLSVEESDTWQCLLCVNFADIPDIQPDQQKEGELTPRERKIAERLVLELYCQYEPSLPFRELIAPDNIDYHSLIKKPIALDSIRHKLDWKADDHYTNLEQLVKDVQQMFKNAYIFNKEGSQVYNDAKTLEKFFDEQLEKLLPHLVYEQISNSEEDEGPPPSKRYRRIITE